MISDSNIQVNRDQCFACGHCVERCILDNLRLSVAPCRTACPIKMNCQGYIRLVCQGKEKEAAEEMRLHTPFGAILGRVCSHPCEDVCERSDIDGAVHIRAIKRYLADSYPDIAYSLPKIQPKTGKHVAVIGSGPAGMMAAYELRKKGHAVTIFEADAEPGGLLRYGIPSFRLPIQEVDRAIGMLEQMRINFKTGQAVGREIDFNELVNEFDAIALAIGTSAPIELDIPGTDSDQVIPAMDFLKMVKQGTSPSIGNSVLVIGGGNSAVDAALTCRKLGIPDVQITCIEDTHEMPAFKLEIREAKEEGVVIENCWGPQRLITREDGYIEVEFSRCISLYNDQGLFDPNLEPTCGLVHQAKMVILAVGQRVNDNGLPKFLFNSTTNRLDGDLLTLQSPVQDKIFVCGDAYSGPQSVVEAFATATESSISIDRFLTGDGLRWGRYYWNGPYTKEYEADPARAEGGPRSELERIPVSQRTIDREVEQTFISQIAKLEAQRCLSCGRSFEANKSCWFCLPCEIECPTEALKVNMPYLIR